MLLLKTVGLTKYYGKKLAIENISFSVSEGEIVGFVGPNGAGKTTTIRTIMGFLNPNDGLIEIFGQRVTKRNFKDIVKNIGYVPGEVNYYDDERVETILRFYKSFYSNFDDEYCEELCRKFDLPLRKKFEELSSGNKKKVAIIQSLAHKPKLIIMDEPTNGLDPFVQRLLYTTLEELRDKGVGILLSSHILSEVQRLCDRVIFIKEGHIVEPKRFEPNMKKIVLKVADNAVEVIKWLLNDFPEITDLHQIDGGLILYMKWNTERFKKFIQNINFEDITIEDLSIEDIFEELYQPTIKVVDDTF
jgi:ABC-2 type transport system ATP-binding protein